MKGANWKLEMELEIETGNGTGKKHLNVFRTLAFYLVDLLSG